MAEKAKVCQQCGTREEEWEEDRYAYISDMKRCPGCELLEMERDNVPTDNAKGVKVFLLKNFPGLETSDGVI